jgi:transposase
MIINPVELRLKMLWGGSGEHISIAALTNPMEPRHDKTQSERFQPMSRPARVRHGMIQLAWRFLLFQKDSALAQWYRKRTADAPSTRKTLIVALARKLLIALWRLARDGVVPDGVRMRPAA